MENTILNAWDFIDRYNARFPNQIERHEKHAKALMAYAAPFQSENERLRAELEALKVVVPRDEEINKYLNTIQPYARVIAAFAYTQAIEQLKSLNPTLTFTELNHNEK